MVTFSWSRDNLLKLIANHVKDTEVSPASEIEEQEQHDSVNSGPIVVPAHVRIRVCACVLVSFSVFCALCAHCVGTMNLTQGKLTVWH